MQTFWNTVGEILAQAIWPLLYGFATYLAMKVRDSRASRVVQIDSITTADVEINVVLDRCLKTIGADRIYLAKFHNGDHFVDSSEIVKYSRTHERTLAGVSPQADQFRDQLISRVADEMELIQEAGPGYRVVDGLPHGTFRWLNERAGVRAVARAAVIVNSKIVGFVGLDFMRAAEHKTCEGQACKKIDCDLCPLMRCAEELAKLMERR